MLYNIQYSPKLFLQAEEARKKAVEDMDPKQREAFENIKFYKFYPVKTPDTPDVNVKVWSCSSVLITLNVSEPATLDLTWYLLLSAVEVHQQILSQGTLSDVMVFLMSHVC